MLCFNPRPTRRPGATGRRWPPWMAATLFQSSPDPKAGRTGLVAQFRGVASHVSILARPEGRAPRAPRPSGRRQEGSVSILARPEGRAPLASPLIGTFTDTFQSSPDPKAGRHGISKRPSSVQPRFQSSPDPKAGRHIPPALFPPRGQYAGFNPRPTRRPGATTRPFVPSTRPCFNPRPTRRPGAHEDGAITVPSGVLRGFNPRPTRRPGATFHFSVASPPMIRFQSSPDPKAGRHAPLFLCRPRAALVSILARPEGRALQLTDAQAPFADHIDVSILARPEGRAPPSATWHSFRDHCFNPRPTRRPGAAIRPDAAQSSTF